MPLRKENGVMKVEVFYQVKLKCTFEMTVDDSYNYQECEDLVHEMLLEMYENEDIEDMDIEVNMVE